MDNLRLQVVDDEQGMRLGVARALRHFRVSLPELDGDFGFEVVEAADGRQALELIGRQAPDVLLLDHKLPDTSGLELLEQIRAMNLDLIVIMATAYASLETAVAATKSGAYDFLAKPFTPEELKDSVRKATRHLMLQREARRLAAEKRQIRFRFISVLAHEMKAPLAAVEGYLRIIKERAAGDDPAVYDHMVDRSLVRLEGMRKMIFDLLDLTAIESGQKKRELAGLDVVEVAQAAVETFLPDARERRVTLTLDAPAPAPLFADRGEIEIILNNLISNAIKYNRDGGSVTVSVAGGTGRVRLVVRDTGIGMTAADAARLFNDFVRIKNEKTRKIMGSGLGLSIVKKLASQYDGGVSVASEPDKGSVFTVELANARPEAGGPAEAVPAPATAGGN
ncbi:MAG: Signal-transduction histidine kinase senX3 [Lentisphaerae bacterium ADurb.BinA184]|nr:MAG: Signal-transduction histidine kinase senX3 [Lentisphaerae bacterium ADurb.BinA184]